LSWRGKHTLLLSRGHGSWFFLGELYTDLPLPIDEPEPSHCGTCMACIQVCPTQAIIAPYKLDARRCISYLTIELKSSIPVELRPLIGNRIYGCDDCQDVCPPTIRFGPTRRAAAQPAAKAWVAVLELLNCSDAELLARWSPWYLADRDPRWIRRNALVVLGNIGDPKNLDVQTVLSGYLADDDPVLREHAEWAAGHLGLSRVPS
jgi:epoxyqueuosine reductase